MLANRICIMRLMLRILLLKSSSETVSQDHAITFPRLAVVRRFRQQKHGDKGLRKNYVIERNQSPLYLKLSPGLQDGASLSIVGESLPRTGLPIPPREVEFGMKSGISAGKEPYTVRRWRAGSMYLVSERSGLHSLMQKRRPYKPALQPAVGPYRHDLRWSRVPRRCNMH